MTEESEKSKSSGKDISTRIGEKVGHVLVIMIILFLFYGLFKAVSWGYGIAYPFHGHTNQDKLASTLSVAIRNDADLSAMKTIFNNRIIDKTLQSRWLGGDDGEYLEPVSLAAVLEDMRAEYFLGEKQNNEFLASLDALIKENNEVNPFDKLQSHQRDFFASIRIKLNENYPLVENDILKLSDEISNQNELVKEYLSDTTTSLIISITGLIIALIVSAIQIIQNRKKRSSDDARHYQLLETANKAINTDD